MSAFNSRPVNPTLPEDGKPRENLFHLFQSEGKSLNHNRWEMTVLWGSEPITLMAQKVVRHYSDGTYETCTLITKERSRITTPLLTLQVGVPFEGSFNEHVLKVSCLSGSDKWAGKKVIVLLRDLASWLGCRKIILVDGSSVSCSATDETYDLSFYMLMRYGLSWYMRQGFSPYLGPAGDQVSIPPEEAAVLVDKWAAKFKAVTVAHVIDDLKSSVAALSLVIKSGDFRCVNFESGKVMTRSKGVVDIYSPSYIPNIAQIVFSIHLHLSSALSLLEDSVRFRSREKFCDVLIRLQAENCALFHSVYFHLFDNEIYYWRNASSPFNFEVGQKKYHQRIVNPLIHLGNLVGGGHDWTAWMVSDVPAKTAKKSKKQPKIK